MFLLFSHVSSSSVFFLDVKSLYFFFFSLYFPLFLSFQPQLCNSAFLFLLTSSIFFLILTFSLSLTLSILILSSSSSEEEEEENSEEEDRSFEEDEGEEVLYLKN